MVHVGLTADSVADLVGHVSDLVHGIRQEAVRFHEVEGAESEQLERDAHVAVVVKPVQHLHTVTGETRSTEMRCIRLDMHQKSNIFSIHSLSVGRLSLADLLQHVDLQFGCFSVFLQVLDDLQSDSTSSSAC